MKSNARISKFLMGTASIAALTMGLNSSVAAQDGEFVVEEIMVTATKRSASIQDIPMSVSALSGEGLTDSIITEVRDMDKVVPGLSFKVKGNDVTPIMRGAGAAGTSDIAVPIYIDGSYRPRASMALAGFLDVERVETLRGPQGTMFGRNSLGGLIHVVTKKPGMEEFEFGGAVTVGDYGQRKVEGFVNVPVGDKFAIRLTAKDTKHDPYQDNVSRPGTGFKDEDNTYARFQVQFDASEDLTLRAGYTYWRDTANGNGAYGAKPIGVPINLDRVDASGNFMTDGINGYMDQRYSARVGFNGGRDNAGLYENGEGLVLSSPYEIDFDFAPQREIKEDTVFFALEYQMENHELKINADHTEYSEVRFSDADFSPQANWVEGQDNGVKADQIDIHMNSTHDGDFQYTVGGYYYDSMNEDTGYAWLFGYNGDWTGLGQDQAWWSTAGWVGGRSDFGAKSYALYGNGVYSLSEKLRAEVGLRYSKDKRSNGIQAAVADSNDSFVPEYTAATSYEVGNDNSVDWKIGLSYDVSDDMMIYTSASSAYIAGGLSGGTNSKLLAAQEAKSLEAGFKSTWLDGRMTWNASVFMVKYTNLLTTVFSDSGVDGIIIASSEVAGSIKSKGIESELRFTPMDNFHIDVNTSFDFSEFDEFGQPNPFEVGPVGFELKGRQLPYTPDFTMGVAMSYDADLGNMGTITPWIYSYTSTSYKAHEADYFFSRQEGFTKIDVAVTWRSEDEMVSLKAFVKNLTDQATISSVNTFSLSRVMADYADPRVIGIRLGYNF